MVTLTEIGLVSLAVIAFFTVLWLLLCLVEGIWFLFIAKEKIDNINKLQLDLKELSNLGRDYRNKDSDRERIQYAIKTAKEDIRGHWTENTRSVLTAPIAIVGELNAKAKSKFLTIKRLYKILNTDREW